MLWTFLETYRNPDNLRELAAFLEVTVTTVKNRLRNMQITFLKPTPEQLSELERDATTNWEEFERRQGRPSAGQSE